MLSLPMQKRHARTLAALYAKPPLHAIRWSEIEGLLAAVGTVEEREGSRVAAVVNGVVAVFHRPHPKPEVGPKTIKQVAEYLKRAGVRP
jgi:HicA toxin of bacterial toxin-antitoxin,